MSSSENKENDYSQSNNNLSSKNSNSKSKFSSLIKSANEEIKINHDTKFAQSIQKSEISNLSAEWIQEIVGDIFISPI